jgi:hypothetical protein
MGKVRKGGDRWRKVSIQPGKSLESKKIDIPSTTLVCNQYTASHN